MRSCPLSQLTAPTTVPRPASAPHIVITGYSTFISAILYPVVAHWAWCSSGWLGYGTLKPLLGCGMIDFAGSGVVHMLGGLTGAYASGGDSPRAASIRCIRTHGLPDF